MDEMELVVAAMAGLDLDTLHLGVQSLVTKGYDTQVIVELLERGMQQVGDRFAQGQYFLADLIVSGMMFKSALSLVSVDVPPPDLDHSRGRVLIGVMANDIHDIGKDIVAQVLQTEHFDVLDLGVDVPPEAFVQAAEKYSPDIIALSGVMGGSTLEMKRVVDALEQAGIFPATPVLVGGACVSELILENIGLVDYATGPIEALRYCVNVVES